MRHWVEGSGQLFARETFTRPPQLLYSTYKGDGWARSSCGYFRRNYCTVRIKEMGGHEVAVDTLEKYMVLRLPGMEPRLCGVISGFRRDVDEICALLGCYAEWSGNSLPTMRDDLSVPSSRVSYAAQSGKTLPMFRDNLSAPFSSLDP
jgi:hypothetical protein